MWKQFEMMCIAYLQKNYTQRYLVNFIGFSYKYFTKKNILTLDILAFFVSVALAQIISSVIAPQLNANLWTVALGVLFLGITTILLRISSRPQEKQTDHNHWSKKNHSLKTCK